MQASSSAYKQLAHSLRNAIWDGDYGDGRKLPTEAELSATYSLSRQTVRRAMQDLVVENLIYRIPGRGTYAVSATDRYIRHFGTVDDLMALSQDTEFQVIRPLQLRINIEAAGRLRLVADNVMEVIFIRLHKDQPFCLTTVYLPPQIGDAISESGKLNKIGDRSRDTIIGLIEEHFPAIIQETEQSITAVSAADLVLEHLGCGPGDPLLRVDRLYLDSAGKPVELAVSFFDPNHYSYRIKLLRQLG
jgi:GntR family transcriptional regulator